MIFDHHENDFDEDNFHKPKIRLTQGIEGKSGITSISITVYLERFNNLKWKE